MSDLFGNPEDRFSRGSYRLICRVLVDSGLSSVDFSDNLLSNVWFQIDV